MAYTIFRKKIRALGFYFVQKSVYVKLLEYYDKRIALQRSLENLCPLKGNVRLIYLTVHQYEKGYQIGGEASEAEKLILHDQQILEF